VALPDLIEIVPLNKQVRAQITVPGSKSITNRALILAALAEGETTLQGALWSEDTQVMVECLQELGFMVNVQPDPDEAGNRTITVYGKGGTVPTGGTEEQPLELFVGNAGTAARFLAAFVCLGRGVYRLHGVPRMHERPQAALFRALRELGYAIKSPNDRLPVLITGGGRSDGKCHVSIEESSQFASALLLAGGSNWQVEIVGANPEEQPYVEMTKGLMRVFPKRGGLFRIEADASSGSYFVAAGWLLQSGELAATLEQALTAGQAGQSPDCSAVNVSSVSVRHWPKSGWQIDARFLEVVFGAAPPSAVSPGGTTLPLHRVPFNLPGEVSREQDLGDSIMTVAVLAPLASQLIRLTGLQRLRLQETERVFALRTELSKCGAQVVEQGEILTILPSSAQLHGAEIETYNDHRMAMSFSILGLKVPGIKIGNPACVKKTFPNFYQKLAAAPPMGLGVTIQDGRTGRELGFDGLFAD
jgi:3-phosphoshikimate 1-carboxyvinyltransferase